MIDDDQLSARGEAVLSIFRRGADFTKQILSGNALENFEESHPRLTGIVGRIADALSDMGI